MLAAAGQIPDQPGVHRSEGQLAGFCPFARPGDIVQYPRHLCSGEIRVDDKARLLPDRCFSATLTEFVACSRRAAVLPDDGVIDRLARFTIPDDGRLALVGDAHRRDISRPYLGLAKHFNGGAELRCENLERIMFHPSGLRVDLREFLLRPGMDFSFPGEENGARTGGSLIEGKDKGHGFEPALFSAPVFHILG